MGGRIFRCSPDHRICADSVMVTDGTRSKLKPWGGWEQKREAGCCGSRFQPRSSSAFRAGVACFRHKCAVKGTQEQWVKFPPGNWLAPPSGNRSSRRGSEVAGASGVEGRAGDSAACQNGVNAVQVSKRLMQGPTLLLHGEGRIRPNCTSEQVDRPAGVLVTACIGDRTQSGKPRR